MDARRFGLAALFFAGAAGAASGADLALVIGNERYDELDDVRSGYEVISAARGLSRAGVEVIRVSDGTQPEMLEAVAEFLRTAPGSEGLLVVLAGRFLSTATDTYLLPVDSEGPALADLPGASLPVSLLLAALAEAEGPALLVLASDADDTRFGRYVAAGLGGVRSVGDVPIIATDPEHAADLVFNTLSQEGAALRPEVVGRDGTRIIGPLPSRFAFIDRYPPDAAREEALWRAARERDEVEGYRDYLEAYQNGTYAVEAQLRLEAAISDPQVRAHYEERGLNLSGAERREIQRRLTLLGHNTRGIDGVFGRGTRLAVTDWQQSNDLRMTGYLDRSQIALLERQAVARSTELEAEAGRRAGESERADRTYWSETGARGGEANIRAYLERFPDGRYAEIAQNRLGQIEESRRLEAAGEERATWDRANRSDTVAAYQSYLERFPNGAFREEATARRDALRRVQADADMIAAAREEEAEIGLNPFTARVVEERLNALGLRPGPVDGEFDEATRRALRRYQQDRNIPASGYLNEPTMVRLLADSIGSLLR